LWWHKHFVHCWIIAGMPTEHKQLIHSSQIAAHKTLSAPESPLSLCYVTGWERRGEWDCACAQNLNTCCFIPCGKLTNACVFKAIMADWNRSIHFDAPCILHMYRSGFVNRFYAPNLLLICTTATICCWSFNRLFASCGRKFKISM
jgi:hypothetical protein